MSDTKKEIKRGKHKPNPYGICMCINCKAGRLRTRHSVVDKIKHKYRTSWKTNKKEKRGAYTD